jgi:hypothetical protein
MVDESPESWNVNGPYNEGEWCGCRDASSACGICSLGEASDPPRGQDMQAWLRTTKGFQ